MTIKETERLAVVETQIAEMKLDVAEIKTDVKLLMHSANREGGALVLLRTVMPWLLTAFVAFLAFMEFVDKAAV